MTDPEIQDDEEDDEIGYGKPPKHSRFQKGKSGNPRGRPRAARGLRSELKAELEEMVTISENGKSRRVRKLRVILKALATRAAKGNVAAADRIVSMVIQFEGIEDQRTAKQPLSANDQAVLDAFLGGAGGTQIDPAIEDQTLLEHEAS